MNNIHSNPSPLRQKFIQYLTLHKKAERTVHAYVSFIYALAKFHRQSPDQLGSSQIEGWLFHLISERKLAPSTVNIAINALRAFFGGLLQRDIHLLLSQIQRPNAPPVSHGPTAWLKSKSFSPWAPKATCAPAPFS
jgi:site-specific recombinase XerD